MKRYLTSKYDTQIHEVDVIRETSMCVFVAGYRPGQEKREAKESGYHKYFDTWEEAHSHLKDRLTKELQWAKENLERTEMIYKKVMGMTNP